MTSPRPLDHAECSRIEARHGSPFYVLHRERFAENMRLFAAAFRSCWERVLVGYSYKTNYLPEFCRLARELGAYAEVVSRLEYDLALRLGQPSGEIIFNGPIKSREDIHAALGAGSTVNLDSWHEVESVAELAARGPFPGRVGLRVNMDLSDAGGASHIQEGLHVSRFGFPPQELRRAAERLARAGVPLRALHGHTSSSSRQAWIYERIAAELCRLAEELAPETVEDINVGGGFFGRLPAGFGPADAPGYEQYAQAVARALTASAWARRASPRLVVEPGVAVVADALSLVGRVVAVKELRGNALAVVDASTFHTKPSGHRKPQPFSVIRPQGATGEEKLLDVTGSTCMERDYLLSQVRAAIAPGDYVRVDNVGAYTVTMSPTFIHPAPAVIVREDGGFRAARERQTLEQAFAACRF